MWLEQFVWVWLPVAGAAFGALAWGQILLSRRLRRIDKRLEHLEQDRARCNLEPPKAA